MQLTLISAAIAAAFGFGAAWQLQELTITKIKLEATNERIASQRVARATIERTTTAVIAAQNSAARRGPVLRAAADASRGDLDGLRKSTEAAMRTATASLDACTVATTTAHQLLNQCGAELQTLAERADGHSSDVMLLQEAWPR